MPDAWPFADPENTPVFTLRRIIRGESMILRVLRDGDNGRWQFLDQYDFDVEDTIVVSLREMAQLDQSIREVADLPTGCVAERPTSEQSWRQSPGTGDEEGEERKLVCDLEVSEEAAASEEEQRRYKLRTNPHYSYFCGVIADGSQALMTSCDGDRNLILYKFDSGGVLCRVQKTQLEWSGWVKVYDEGTDSWVDVPGPFVRWQRDLAFVPKVISVRRFSDPENKVGIEDDPVHLRDFLADPEGYIKRECEGEDINDWWRMVQQWRQDGSFVFRCGNDYYCDREGRVESS